MRTTHHLLVCGRVQGVGYRESMRVEARRLGCTGWVRNLRDGSVEAVVSGSDDAVTALIAWAKNGPPAGRVTGVTVAESADEPYESFEVLRTA